VLRPSSFSSRLIRVAAAERPMNTANIGSPTLEMRCAGEGILYVVMDQVGEYVRGADEDGW